MSPDRCRTTVLARLLQRAGMTSAGLLVRLRQTSPWDHLSEAQIEAVSAGASCGPGLLRAWVVACAGDIEDEVDAWVERGWTVGDARQLVGLLPDASRLEPRDASRAADDDASPHAGGGRVCGWCPNPVPERRHGGARPGEGAWCSERCRKAAARFRASAARDASRVDAGDASLQARRDACRPGCTDASADVPEDASRPGEADASLAGETDASPGTSTDASRVDAGDASPAGVGGRVCGWCPNPVPERRRGNARPGEGAWCSKRCRNAASRFRASIQALDAADRPCRLAVADPPYIGLAYLYRDHPDYGGEVDHEQLLHRLATYDGWALACSGESAPQLLVMAHRIDPRVRLGVWVRGEITRRGRVPTSAWEGVLYVPCRPDVAGDQVPDALVFGARRRSADPAWVIGAKSSTWCAWVWGLLQARAGDTLDDLFPGSGGVMRAWREATPEHPGPA